MNWQFFKPDVDLMNSFNTAYMLLDDLPGCNHGFSSIRANADGPPIHKHPHQTQRVTIVEGEMEMFQKGQWRKLTQGESLIVLPNTPHSYRSRSEKDCLFEYFFEPKGHFSDMIRCFGILTQEGKVTRRKNFTSLGHTAMAFKNFSDDVISVSPPDWAITALASLARLAGFKVPPVLTT
jgi:mannose-6-phosphate isomerase-like protein (cupin superfamily)